MKNDFSRVILRRDLAGSRPDMAGNSADTAGVRCARSVASRQRLRYARSVASRHRLRLSRLRYARSVTSRHRLRLSRLRCARSPTGCAPAREPQGAVVGARLAREAFESCSPAGRLPQMRWHAPASNTVAPAGEHNPSFAGAHPVGELPERSLRRTLAPIRQAARVAIKTHLKYPPETQHRHRLAPARSA